MHPLSGFTVVKTDIKAKAKCKGCGIIGIEELTEEDMSTVVTPSGKNIGGQ